MVAQTAETSEPAESPARFVALAEVKELLERENAARPEPDGLSYEQKLALEHATNFARIHGAQSKELFEKLVALKGKITPFHAYKLADLAPKHPDDVRAIFAKDRIAPDNAEIEKILEIVRAYVP